MTVKVLRPATTPSNGSPKTPPHFEHMTTRSLRFAAESLPSSPRTRIKSGRSPTGKSSASFAGFSFSSTSTKSPRPSPFRSAASTAMAFVPASTNGRTSAGTFSSASWANVTGGAAHSSSSVKRVFLICGSSSSVVRGRGHAGRVHVGEEVEEHGEHGVDREQLEPLDPVALAVAADLLDDG